MPLDAILEAPVDLRLDFEHVEQALERLAAVAPDKAKVAELRYHRPPRAEAPLAAMVAGAAPDWDRLFEGYASCVDLPAAWYWRTLIDVYPDAKVVLTLRDSESWWKSFEHIAREVGRPLRRPGSLGVALVANQVLGGRPLDREHAIAVYETHNAAVRATVPASRLLIHHLGDGWEPLCAHLGKPVPDQPYPRRNAAGEFRANLTGHLEAGHAAEADAGKP